MNVQTAALQSIAFAAVIYVPMWLFHSQVLEVGGLGQWRNPPRPIRVLLRRGPGPLRFVPTAAELWALTIAGMGVVLMADLLDPVTGLQVLGLIRWGGLSAMVAILLVDVLLARAGSKSRR